MSLLRATSPAGESPATSPALDASGVGTSYKGNNMTLIERIEAGETGREIDALVYVALHPLAAVNNPDIKKAWRNAEGGAVVDYWQSHSGKLFHSTRFPPSYSTSLDAVMALADELYGGKSEDPFVLFGVSRDRHYFGECTDKRPGDYKWSGWVRFHAKYAIQAEAWNPAAALLAAILKAKETT